MAEKKDATDILQSIKAQREQARAEPPRVNPIDGKVVSNSATPRVPFNRERNKQVKKFKVVRYSSSMSEVSIEALRHLTAVTGMTQRAMIETAVRNYVDTIDPQLIGEIEKTLLNEQ